VYYTDFLHGVNYRESCYECQYANLERIGDITLGDFWGIEEVDDTVITGNGVSAIIVNSQKGNLLLQENANEIDFKVQRLCDIAKYNMNLVRPIKRPNMRDIYYTELTLDYEKYAKPIISRILKILIRKHTPKEVKAFVRKVLKMLRRKESGG
jgi:hypothetical protein